MTTAEEHRHIAEEFFRMAFAPFRETLVLLHHCCGATVADGPGLSAYACPDGPPRDVKAGGYLLPPPTLRLRARLESRGIGWSSLSRRCGQNIPSTVSTSG